MLPSPPSCLPSYCRINHLSQALPASLRHRTAHCRGAGAETTPEGVPSCAPRPVAVPASGSRSASSFQSPGLTLEIAPGRAQGKETRESCPAGHLQNFPPKIQPVLRACSPGIWPTLSKNREGGGFPLSLPLFLSSYRLGVRRSFISDFQV